MVGVSESVESLGYEDEAASRVGRGFGKRSVLRVSPISLFFKSPNLYSFVLD